MKKPDDPTNRVLPVDPGGESITALIDAIGDSGIRSKIRNWQEQFDFEKIKDQKDFAKGFQGVFLCIMYDVVSPKKGEALLKALSGYATHMKAYLEVDFPEQIVEEMQRLVSERDEAIDRLLKSKLSPETYEEIKGVLNIGKQA